MSQYLDLPLSSLRESPTNPRKHFDPANAAELELNRATLIQRDQINKEEL